MPANPPAISSSDGRFELRVEEFWERSSPTYTTRLMDRQTGNEIFSCEGTPPAEFQPDGTLIIRYSGYEPNGVTIDLQQKQFRTHPSEPWSPLHAWALVEAAYRRGWSAAWQYRQGEAETTGVWVEAALSFGSMVALFLLLRFGAALPKEPRIIFSIVAGLAAVFFAWLWLNAVRHSRKQRAMGRSGH